MSSIPVAEKWFTLQQAEILTGNKTSVDKQLPRFQKLPLRTSKRE